jgi:hypothetical protein
LKRADLDHEAVLALVSIIQISLKRGVAVFKVQDGLLNDGNLARSVT